MLSSEESVGTDGEADACLRKTSHFSLRVSRSSFNLSSSTFFFWNEWEGEARCITEINQDFTLDIQKTKLKIKPPVRWCAEDTPAGHLCLAEYGFSWSAVPHDPPHACGSYAPQLWRGCTQTPRVLLLTTRGQCITSVRHHVHTIIDSLFACFCSFEKIHWKRSSWQHIQAELI